MNEKNSFKLGMGQMLVEGGRTEENLKRAEDMGVRAQSSHCDLLVLPECLDLGWTYPEAGELARPIPGEYSERLSRLARECGFYLVAGLTEKIPRSKKVYNSAVLISPKGELLLKHRKINVLEIAQDLYSIGDRLSVSETELGSLGLNICADNFPNSLVLGHSLGRMGAQMLLSPSAWAVEAGHDNEEEPYGEMWKRSFKKLSRLYGMTVVGVSNVGWIKRGPWLGKKCIGSSLAVGPEGKVIAQGPYGVDAETLISIEVTPVESKLRGTALAERVDEGS